VPHAETSTVKVSTDTRVFGFLHIMRVMVIASDGAATTKRGQEMKVPSSQDVETDGVQRG
jgi:hypothetical protein